MNVNVCARDLAIQVEVSDMELAPRFFQSPSIIAENAARQPELCVVRYLKRRVEVAGFKRSEHRAEYLFLGDARHRVNFADDSRLDEPATMLFKRLAAREQST